WAGRMGAIVAHVEVIVGLVALRPIGTHQYPRARGYLAVQLFPLSNKIDRQQKIRVLARLSRTIDDAGACHERFNRDGINRVIGLIAPADPVRGSIKMRTGVL